MPVAPMVPPMRPRRSRTVLLLVLLLVPAALAGCASGAPRSTGPAECAEPAEDRVEAAALLPCAAAHARGWRPDAVLRHARSSSDHGERPFDGRADRWMFVFSSGEELREWRIEGATGKASMEGSSSDLPWLVQPGTLSLAAGDGERVLAALRANATAAGFFDEFPAGGSEFVVNSTGWTVRLDGVKPAGAGGGFLRATLARTFAVTSVERHG